LLGSSLAGPATLADLALRSKLEAVGFRAAEVHAWFGVERSPEFYIVRQLNRLVSVLKNTEKAPVSDLLPWSMYKSPKVPDRKSVV
jgi:hypothetical protein